MGDSTSNKRIAKNTLFLFVRNVFVLLVSLYTSRVVLRTLGVSDYGVYNVVAGFVSMFAFLNSALSSGIQRFYNYELGVNGEKGFTKVYVCATVFQILLIIILVLLLESLGIWYINNKLVVPEGRLYAANVLFQFSVTSLVLVVLGIPYSAAIMAHEKMDFFALVGIIDVILKLAIVIVLPFLTYDQLVAYGFLTLCISILNFLLYYIYSKKHFKTMSLQRFSVDRTLLKSMLGFSGWHVFGTFAQVARTQGVNVILNLFFGTAVNAARGITYQIQAALMGFIGNITTAARPQLVQSYAQSNIGRTISLMYSVGKICFYALLAMAMPVSLEIDYILSLWLGRDAVPEYTSIFTIIVLLIALVDILNTPLSMVVHATGKMRKYQVVTSGISLLILPTGYVAFMLKAPPMAIFVISLFVSIIVQTVSLLIVRELVSFSLREYFSRVVFPIVIIVPVSLALPLSARCLLGEGIIRVLLVSFLSVFSVLLFAFFLGLDRNEKDLVLRFKDSVLTKFNINKIKNK